jgi:hypothetical protein
MKATELERIDRKYANTLDTLDETDRMNRGLESDLHEMKSLKKEWEKHQRIEKLKDRLATLYEAYGWAAYKDSDMQVEQEIEVCTTLALFRSSYGLLKLG